MGCFPRIHLLRACIKGPGQIQVVSVQGTCHSFDPPIIVNEVLMDYPHHALFLSHSVRTLGPRARPLHSSLSLQPGNVYSLIPQPTRPAASGPAYSAALMETSTPPPSCSSRQRKVSFTTSTDIAPGRRPIVEKRRVGFCASSKASSNWGAANSLEKISAVEFLPPPSEGVLRLKMVVSKKQLASLLREGGDCVSMVESLILREAEASDQKTSMCSVSCGKLQSISESNLL